MPDTVWIQASMATPPKWGTSPDYVPCTKVLKDSGAEHTAKLLTLVGYCLIDRLNGHIARIDKTAWETRAKEYPACKEGNEAHFYRRTLTKDTIRGVPAEVCDLLYLSEHAPQALNTIRFKNRLDHWLTLDRRSTELNTPTTEETPAMTNAITELDLNNLPAMEPVPMKTVVVVFDVDGEKENVYFAPETARVGDYCVVYASTGNRPTVAMAFPFVVGKIVRETPDIEGKARAAVLGTFNEEFAQIVQRNMDVRAAVKTKLQQMKRKFEERAIFEMLAEKDPEAKRLLDMLKQFEG